MALTRTHPIRPAHLSKQAGAILSTFITQPSLGEFDSSSLGLELLVADTEFIATITHQVAQFLDTQIGNFVHANQ